MTPSGQPKAPSRKVLSRALQAQSPLSDQELLHSQGLNEDRLFEIANALNLNRMLTCHIPDCVVRHLQAKGHKDIRAGICRWIEGLFGRWFRQEGLKFCYLGSIEKVSSDKTQGVNPEFGFHFHILVHIPDDRLKSFKVLKKKRNENIKKLAADYQNNHPILPSMPVRTGPHLAGTPIHLKSIYNLRPMIINANPKKYPGQLGYVLKKLNITAVMLQSMANILPNKSRQQYVPILIS